MAQIEQMGKFRGRNQREEVKVAIYWNYKII